LLYGNVNLKNTILRPCSKFRNHSGWGREDGDQGGDGSVDGHTHMVATDLQKIFRLSIVLTELLIKLTAKSFKKYSFNSYPAILLNSA
jgi:hypothetical protein